ncbi:MAG: aminotransferase class I/II-fold pyridoxal phosphate-dependent enzyme, partial [Candidatus Sumerlaeota bacterium]|nr:aminotransferase class I/II-fold pyridoxal phosphate-dependent enzyme [Candidatus Sumerlaeota bacterium]
MPPIMQPHLSCALPYPAGRPIEEVEREFGLRNVIKLASNENPLGPSPKALKAMRQCAKKMHLYPDGDCFYLRQALAAKHNVTPEQIIVGGGSDDLNTFIMTSYLGPGRTLVASLGSFIRYEQAAIVSGGEVRNVPFKSWRHDIDALLAAVGPATGALCVANPENPVGCMVTKAETDRLVHGTPDRVFLLLDQAYCEFCQDEPDYPDAAAYARERDNVMATRTFSKAYGLAGLRIGYGISSPRVIETLHRTRPPFNVTRMGQEAALAALEDVEHVERVGQVNREGMAYYEAQFDKMGLEHIKSYANFITVNLRRDAAAVFQAMLRRGV